MFSAAAASRLGPWSAERREFDMVARIFVRWGICGVYILGMAPFVSAQPNDKVESRAIQFWSDGTRLAGNLFTPKSAGEGDALPAILLCHGWGGVKAHLNQTYAPKFAAAGFVVMTFDYRGWGESDSRLVLKGEMPEPDADGTVTVEALAVRELVDPFDQLEDIQAAVNYLEGEPLVDGDRIGLWGTSFGGGLVVWTAAHDDRIDAVVSQVGAMDGRPSAIQTFGSLENAHDSMIERVRGEAEPVPQGENVVEGLRGTPYVERFALYAPVEHAHKLNVPTLLIDAENEELSDRTEHSAKVFEIIKGNVPSRYVVVPDIKHYGIYQAKYQRGSDLALEWFEEHLKR